MSTEYFVDKTGAYIGGFDGVDPPTGAIKVPLPPSDARQVWDAKRSKWGDIPADVPTSVSARQFELQLLAAGKLDQVEDWVALQDRATQVAYRRSASFLREDAMMQKGFAALGFSSEEVDGFFIAASQL